VKVLVRCFFRAHPIARVHELVWLLKRTDLTVVSEGDPLPAYAPPKSRFAQAVILELDVPPNTPEPAFVTSAPHRAPKRNRGVVGATIGSESRAALDLLQRRFMLAELQTVWKSAILGKRMGTTWEQRFHLRLPDTPKTPTAQAVVI
jgi:hypothetical protein